MKLNKFVLILAALALAVSLVVPVTAQMFTTVSVSNGDNANPSITFFNDTDTGFFRKSSNTIGITAGGTEVANLSSNGYNGPFRQTALALTDATYTIALSECGRTFVATKSSATQTFTLPALSGSAGCELTFIAGHASGEILVNAAATATCTITTFAAVGADADTAIVTDTSCDTGLKNTAATNAIGDTLTLVSDGTQWLGKGITSGIWAAQ